MKECVKCGIQCARVACIKCETRSPNMCGALCAACAGELPRAKNHVPATVTSTIPRARATAWLIDPWGQPHAIASGATIGRDAGNDLVIADAHVSGEHATLEHGDGWRVRDRGSTAGTHVGAQRNIRVAPIAHLDTLEIAAIGFYLWARLEPPAAAAAVISTIPNAPDGFRIVGPAGETVTLHAKPGRDAATGDGMLVIGTAQQPLSTLQYQLLRMLCARAIAAGSHGGYIDTRELLRALPFPSPQPQDGNVRQVVRSVRKLLESAKLGLDASGRTTLIEASPRVGYRIAWRVEYVAPGHG